MGALLFFADFFDVKKFLHLLHEGNQAEFSLNIYYHTVPILTSSIQDQRTPLICVDDYRSAFHQNPEGTTNAAHPSRFFNCLLSLWSWGLSQQISAALLLYVDRTSNVTLPYLSICSLRILTAFRLRVHGNHSRDCFIAVVCLIHAVTLQRRSWPAMISHAYVLISRRRIKSHTKSAFHTQLYREESISGILLKGTLCFIPDTLSQDPAKGWPIDV